MTDAMQHHYLWQLLQQVKAKHAHTLGRSEENQVSAAQARGVFKVLRCVLTCVVGEPASSP
jgi:hypothetical protein